LQGKFKTAQILMMTLLVLTYSKKNVLGPYLWTVARKNTCTLNHVPHFTNVSRPAMLLQNLQGLRWKQDVLLLGQKLLKQEIVPTGELTSEHEQMVEGFLQQAP
jgi:hypothetical protein